MHSLRRLVGLAALVAASSARAAGPVGEPYEFTVWASVLFGPDGRAGEIRVIDAEALPPQFLENVKARLARARIPPPTDAGAPASFRTGVGLDFTISPGENGGTAKLDRLQVAPLPLKRYLASYPKDIASTRDWLGGVSAVCTVGVEGRCTTIQVDALPGMPESVRRFARVSFEGWVFEPQRLNDRPVEGESRARFQLHTLDDAPEQFRQPKFERIIQSR